MIFIFNACLTGGIVPLALPTGGSVLYFQPSKLNNNGQYTQRRYSAAAWSLLDALSGLRRTVQQELDFLHHISEGLSAQRLEDAMLEIESFTSEVSAYLGNLPEMEEEEMEEEYQRIAGRFDELKYLVRNYTGR